MDQGPVGIIFFSKIFGFENQSKGKRLNIFLVLILTFFCYAALHACRKILPVVKNKLQGTCDPSINKCVDGFAPFDTPQRHAYFAILDMSWAFSYALGMLFMGHAAERSGRKAFLVISLYGTGLTVMCFGIGYYLKIHSLYYYISLQILNGIFQSAGWPTIISIVSSWVSKKSMGTILGFWGNHYAVGNIIGQSLSSIYVDSQWGMSYIVNGSICTAVGLLVVLFLASKPKTIGLESKFVNDTAYESLNDKSDSKKTETSKPEETPITFKKALFFPGVLEFSFSLFFCKIVVYTFLFWLPYYINSVGIKNYDVTPKTAGFLASLFDVGGILGNILSGFVLDIFKTGGSLCFLLQLFACISIFLFSTYGNSSFVMCIVLLLVSGMFVNAPNVLITGTISASLANKKGSNKKATTTISAIIDGVGSLGAAFAPIIVKQISYFGWNYVMYTLMASCAISGLLLTRLVFEELLER